MKKGQGIMKGSSPAAGQENSPPRTLRLKLPSGAETAEEDPTARFMPTVRAPASPTPSADEVTDEVLQLWIRRCKRRFLQGVPVIKVSPNGKLVRRQMYIGAKPEYLELISSRLFDTAYHLFTIESVENSLDSPDFDAFRLLEPGCMPKQEKSLVIRIQGAVTVSLVFADVGDRRDAQIYLRAQIAMVNQEGEEGFRDYERVKTLPAIRTIHIAPPAAPDPEDQ